MPKKLQKNKKIIANSKQNKVKIDTKINKSSKKNLTKKKDKILTKKTPKIIKKIENKTKNIEKNIKQKPNKTLKKEINSSAKNKLNSKNIESKNHSSKNENLNKSTNNSSKSNNFSINSYIVYPSHGIGKIINIENTLVMQQNINCYLIHFEKEKLVIKIPVDKADKFGIRPLVSKAKMDEVFKILRSGVKKMKGMWSRRAQEYEVKINSGDIFMLAEVLRDLTRDIEDSERSYSERIIYETAIYRLASEYAAIYNISLQEAMDKVVVIPKDKIESNSKSHHKNDDFDDFKEIGEDDENEDDEEEEEEDDFNYEYNESEEFEDEEEDEKPKKKNK